MFFITARTDMFQSLLYLKFIRQYHSHNREGYDLSKAKFNSETYGWDYRGNFSEESFFLGMHCTQQSCGFGWTLPLSVKIPNPRG